MISVAFWRETLLNIFGISSDIKHLVGGLFLISGSVLFMYFSISLERVRYTILFPPLTPMVEVKALL